MPLIFRLVSHSVPIPWRPRPCGYGGGVMYAAIWLYSMPRVVSMHGGPPPPGRTLYEKYRMPHPGRDLEVRLRALGRDIRAMKPRLLAVSACRCRQKC